MTDKEKERVSKKYGLIKDDYKPRPYSGDYPDLKGVGAWDRDNMEVWDYPETKKNFMEPGPYYDRDVEMQARYSESFQYASRARLGSQLIFVVIMIGFLILNDHLGQRNYFPMMPKQKPYDESGKKIVNYSMESA
ncbi:NADH dehydrogenase [ubiquinone] 1 beta subcomplex subunit 8, mitochondrial [Mizuhopecten yessoensis]|uniref:NADH dehydrogenase [ubiquinone] 1 beta subcomplex subunit 8, mitochondrial n=2 Tax=Mizuhopecten yessoensis TaxID=6573 RepID=A0A210PM45_MIZYE|nr:NADH dehydrogenase [ubiquinone] 1 beta subcomplex subunit 8, mitochondrial [Mizuhopecten yessoensis]